MERYFKRKRESSPPSKRIDDHDAPKQNVNGAEIDLLNLPADPGLRPRILDYNSNIRDQVRRAYWQKGPCQPKDHNFPYNKFGKVTRRFNLGWYENNENWLEYSIAKDAVFCLCCYLFKPNNREQSGGDSFVVDGYQNWKKRERLAVHVGGPNSAYNQVISKCEALSKQDQHIKTFFSRHSDQARSEYRVLLNASIDCIRFLLKQGLAFRGNDESDDSNNKGNFLELLEFLADHDKYVRDVTLKNAPENLKLTSPDIQKDIVSDLATETINVIIKEMDDSLFSILIDKSRDVSVKEQMAVVFRYVNKKGNVVDRFIGVEHVTSTTALSLKASIDDLFSRHELSICRLRGQGYDGASNMQGEFNGLKSLIMKENECADYIHYFAHQLQLSLVSVAKNHSQIQTFFSMVANVVNVVRASCKRCDVLWEKQAILISEALNNGELSSGRSLNQETTLKRSGDTRWGSHYGTLISIITMFSSIIDVLEDIVDDRFNSEQRSEANVLLDFMQSFDFVFSLHLMKEILGFTTELSQALQRKDQDIVNAMKLVGICKQRLQVMRDYGCDSLFNEVSSFCIKHSIDVPNMDDLFLTQGRPRRKAQEMTNLHRYRVEQFYSIMDMQLQELNSCFNEMSTELLLCLACLCPNDSFIAFNKQKLICLAQFYPKDFSAKDIMALEIQLETYIMDMRSSIEFSGLKEISDLAEKMVRPKKISCIH